MTLGSGGCYNPTVARRESKPVRSASTDTPPTRSVKAAVPEDRPILVVTGCVGRSSPAAGGWGYVICYPTGQEVEAGGMAAETTAARMALTAVVRALERLGPAERGPVRVVTSSQPTVDTAAGRLPRRGDLDLWTHLDGLARDRRIIWEWEPDETMYFQERAAELAQLAVKRGRAD